MDQEPALTIIDLKLAFLRPQILALSAPVRVPPNYRPSSSHPIRAKAIDDALYQLNARIKEHAKMVYSAQAQRHVAEQIDALYWMAGERNIDGEIGEGRLEFGMDFSKPETIEALPDAWDDESEAARQPEEAEHYAELVNHLKSLKERKEEMRAKIERYKALKRDLEPLNEPSRNVQENLCTRNSAVEEELQKMRMLLARVNGRLETLPPATAAREDSGDPMEGLDDEKKMVVLFG